MAQLDLKAIITADDRSGYVFNRFSNSINSLGKDIDRFALTQLKRVGIAAGAAFGAASVFAVKSAADYEQQRVAFETMLGSAQKAGVLLKDVADFAAKTPFELPEVVEGSKQLLAMGSSANDVLKELKMLGDVSAGLGVPMERLILNFGQVRVQGQLTGRELRDFAIAGVPLIDELAKNLGVTKERIADMVSEGKIGFPEVSTAFETMTSNGGKFEDLMDKQSKTFSGIVSNMSDEIGRLARDIIGINEAGEIIEGGFFERIKGAAERLLTYLSDNKEQIKAVVEETAQKIISFGTRVYEAIQSLIDFWKTSFGKTTIIAIGILVAALAGAAGSIVGIVALITGTIYLVYRAAKEVAGLWGDMWRLAEAYFREFQVRIWSRAIEIKNNLVGWARDTVNEIIDWFRTLPSRISSSISSATTGAASKIKGLLGFRAEGGPVSAGNPYIVGEKGPELFVPSGNGNIVPNNQISNSATVNFYGNINNTSNASLDDIGRRISRQIQLASQGI